MRLIHEDTETNVDNYGETGGPDRNLGKEFSKRYTWQDENTGKFTTITTTTYITARDADNEDVDYSDLAEKVAELEKWRERYSFEVRKLQELQRAGQDFWLTDKLREWEDENPQPIRFSWEEQSEISEHDELDEVGDGDIEYEYGDGSYMFFDSVADAEEDAKATIDRLSATMFGFDL